VFKKTIIILISVLMLLCFSGIAFAEADEPVKESSGASTDSSFDSGGYTGSDSGSFSVPDSSTAASESSFEPISTDNSYNDLGSTIPDYSGGSPEPAACIPDSEEVNTFNNEPQTAEVTETDAVPDTPASTTEENEEYAEENEEYAEENEENAKEDPGFIDPYFYSSGGKQEYEELHTGDPGDPGALDDFRNQNGKGFIFIEREFVHDGDDIAINPDDHPNLAGLVFQDYYPKEGSEFVFDPFDTTYWPVINANLTISRMPSGFTLLGLVINGAVTFEDCIGQLNLTYLEVSNPDGDGITIDGTEESNSYSHKGNVVIDNVKSNNNYGYGAYIDNWHSGNVTVTSSEFNGNGFDYTPEDPEPQDTGVYNGLEIGTRGVVTIDGITASHNNGTGLEVYNFSRLTMKNSAFMGNSNSNVINPDTGMKVYGGGFLADSYWRNAPVILENIYAHNNGHYGSRIKTGGAVTIKNLFTNGNEYGGSYVRNTYGKGNVLFNDGHFYGNSGAGLLIISSSTVTLNSMHAFNNLEGGAIVYARNVTVTSPKAAGQAGANTMGFNGKWDDEGVVEIEANGLEIHSAGHVVVTNLDSFNNSANGLYIQNDYAAGNVTINTNIPGFSNSFGSNSGSGVLVRTNGNLVVTDTSAGNNERYGLLTYYDDDPGPENLPAEIIPAKAVTITRGWFNDNADNGLIVFATGNITLTDVAARNNGHRGRDGFYSGAVLINGKFYYEYDGDVIYNFDGGKGNITVRSSAVDSYNGFEDNSGNGLAVFSNGVVSLTNIEASRNSGGSGVHVRNSDASSARAVNLLRINSRENAQNGVIVESRGALKLTDIRAENNGLIGVVLENDVLKAGNVAITRANIRYNGWTEEVFGDDLRGGLFVFSQGAITLIDVLSEDNGGTGALLDSSGGSGGVTIRSSKADNYYHFSRNEEVGLEIYSGGAVQLNNVIAEWNRGGPGVLIEVNDAAGTKGTVRVALSNFRSNEGSGLDIKTLGAVTLDRVEAGHNTVRNYLIEDGSARFDQRLSWDMDGARYYFNNSDANNENLFELATYGFEGGLALYKKTESGEYEELDFNNTGTMVDGICTTALDYTENGDKLDAGDYMLLVSTAWWGGHSGEYTLFFNGEDEAYGKCPTTELI